MINFPAKLIVKRKNLKEISMSLRSGTVGRLKYWLERMLGGGGAFAITLSLGSRCCSSCPWRPF